MKDAYLIVVDVQNDFLPGGALPVPQGDKVIEPINRLIDMFGQRAVLTLDWHPEDHCSFAASHKDKKPFDKDASGDTLWPTHCVATSWGAKWAPGLLFPPRVEPKGSGRDSDSYSGFYIGEGRPTNLKSTLRAANASTVVICGLATDYCVKATALDARKFGFKTIVAVDACRGVDVLPGDVEAAYLEMVRAGVELASVESIVNPTGKKVYVRLAIQRSGAAMMIDSILDTDLYKLTMAQAVLCEFPEVEAKYEFINRDKSRKFNSEFADRLCKAVDLMSTLELRPAERAYLETLPYFSREFLAWLSEYRFNPGHVSIEVDVEGQLHVSIAGPWRETIFWEVPLLATISELYFANQAYDKSRTVLEAGRKREMLDKHKCNYVDFGTRRRFSYETHVLVNHELSHGVYSLGTSNVSLAGAWGMPVVGTMAHEWIQAISALDGVRHANRYAIERWLKVYNGCLGIALTDTFGSEAFFRDFDGRLARVYDGVRQDSGDPIAFIDKVVTHYRSVGVNAINKTIIFSDSLTVDKAIELKESCDIKGIRCAFGIGTHFTNDIPGVKPLNIVIKLREIDGIEVVKLSDDPGKEVGSAEAVKQARSLVGMP